MTANRDIYDGAIDRAAMLRLFEQKMLGKVDLELNGHSVRMNKLLSENMHARSIWGDIDRELAGTYDSLDSITSRDLRELCSDQAARTSGLLSRVLGDIADVSPPMGRISEEIVLERPLYNDVVLRKGWAGISNRERIGIEAAIRNLLAKGAKESDIVRAVSPALGVAKNQAVGLVRTAITSIRNQADHEVYKANANMLRGWQYVAILDSRTTPICAHRDGHIYPVGDVVHLPPAHWHCRSATVPVVKSFDSLAKLDNIAGIRKRNLMALSEKQRAYYDGEAYSDNSYQDWLIRQPYEVRLAHLGDSAKVEMFSNRVLEVDRFNVGDRTASLSELRQGAQSALGAPGDVRRFADAKVKLDAIKLSFSSPDELIGDVEHAKLLREYYRLQAGELDGTLSLTNYRGALIHNKKKTKERVLNVLPTEEQMIFNPVTGRYEDARMYAPNPSVLAHRLVLVERSDALNADDKEFIARFIDSLSDTTGANERAVIADNLRVTFERFRRSGKVWGNTKAVLNSQIQFDVMNVSESLETAIRLKSDPFKRLKELAFIDPVLGPVYLEDIRARFIDNIIARNLFEDKELPRLAEKIRGSILPRTLRTKLDSGAVGFALDGRIPLKVWNRMSELDVTRFFEKVAGRLSMADLPDRDALAVSIGRQLYETSNFRGSKGEWYKAGLAVLDPLEKDGLIAYETFGVQKRRMRSRITGQYFGQYYDTFSETVRILDPGVHEYAKLNREIDLGLRVGFTEEPTLIVRPGFKTYFIKRGNIDTRIPLTSDSSFGDFPEEAITDDMADALNWSANTRYVVDVDTYDGVNRLLNFVDDRGAAKKYEDLNHFRKYLASRGDTYERFKAMEWHRETGNTFSNMPFLDHRGRIYDRGLIGPQSGETFRPFLSSPKALPLGEEGYDVFRDQVGAFFGGLDETFEGNFNSLTVSGRLGVSDRLRKDMTAIGNALIRGKPSDMRFVLDSEFMQRIDGEDYAKAARLCIEAAKIDRHLKGDYNDLSKLREYYTTLVLEQDASSSGAQIIALTTKNKQLAALSNVIPTDQKRRLYDEIAARTYVDPRFVELNKKLGLTERDLRKAAKAQNMVTLYGAGARTGTLNVERKLAKVLGKDSTTLVVSTTDRDKVLSEISARAARYQKYDPETYEELMRLRKDVKSIFTAGKAPGDDIMEALYFLDQDTRDVVEKMTRQYDRTVTPDDFVLIAKIMSENLASQAPILRDFTKYFGRLAESFLLNADPAKSDFDFKYELMRRLFGEKELRRPEQKFLDVSFLRKLNSKLSLAGYLPSFTPNATELDRRRLIKSAFLKELIRRAPGWDPNGVLDAMLFGVERKEDVKKWVHVPWVNFDGVTMEQYFTQSFEERLSYRNERGEWITNILMIDQKEAPSMFDELTNASNKINDMTDVTKAKTAYAVNGNHSNDAVLVKRFHLWGKSNDIGTSTIHDAFFTHIAHMPRAKDALRQEYARAATASNVRATLDEMRRRGLPGEEYERFLEEAISIGIIPVPGRSVVGGKTLTTEDILTAEDILDRTSRGMNRSWYAVGG